jgi:Trp operon repressor
MPVLQKLSLKHYQIAHLLAQGKSQRVIAQRLNINPSTIQNCLDTPAFHLVLSELREKYESELIERTILPIAEMQNKINEEAFSAFNRIVDLSCSDRANTGVLNANLAIIDRASNMPKASKVDTSESQKDLFNVNIVQLVLETALQVGDKTILASAQKALNNIPQISTPGPSITLENEEYSSKQLDNKLNSSPFTLRSLDDALDSLESDEE